MSPALHRQGLLAAPREREAAKCRDHNHQNGDANPEGVQQRLFG